MTTYFCIVYCCEGYFYKWSLLYSIPLFRVCWWDCTYNIFTDRLLFYWIGLYLLLCDSSSGPPRCPRMHASQFGKMLWSCSGLIHVGACKFQGREIKGFKSVLFTFLCATWLNFFSWPLYNHTDFESSTWYAPASQHSKASWGFLHKPRVQPVYVPHHDQGSLERTDHAICKSHFRLSELCFLKDIRTPK